MLTGEEIVQRVRCDLEAQGIKVPDLALRAIVTATLERLVEEGMLGEPIRPPEAVTT